MAKEEATAPAKCQITHVIFDMDGLLLDTEPFYTLVQEKILERFDKTFDWSLKAKLMGKKAIESARIFVEECGLTGILTPEAFLEERQGMLQELFPTCQLLPGVKRLVHHLHENRISMCVATGTYKRDFDLKTQRHGEIFSLMHHVVMGDDPDVKQASLNLFWVYWRSLAQRRTSIFSLWMSDIFMCIPKAKKMALESNAISLLANFFLLYSLMLKVIIHIFVLFKSIVDVAEILVFEDAPSGVAAAKNAGMSVVMVPDPRLDVSHHKEADQVLASLLDFNPSQWGLPPFTDDVN